MDNIQWFKIQVLYPLTSTLSNMEDDEDPLLKRIRFEQDNTDGYQIDFAYINLALDPIVSLQPCCMLPKDGKNKKYYTEITLQSDNVLYAVGKPEVIYDKINEYLNSLPEIESN